jgi:hypothetical protein
MQKKGVTKKCYHPQTVCVTALVVALNNCSYQIANLYALAN